MATKLVELRAENFKRLVAVVIRPNAVGVTQIIGENEAGKTSAIDAISAALGGGSYSPELPIRRGATSAQVVCDLGDIIVKRKWTAKGSTLDVTNAEGVRITGGAQGVLDKLWNKTAIDPKAFERMSAKEQAATLARIAGVNLDEYQGIRQVAYDRRTVANRHHTEAEARLRVMVKKEAPVEPIDVAGLMAELDAARKHNQGIERLETDLNVQAGRVQQAETHLADLRARLEEMIRKVKEMEQTIGVQEEKLSLAVKTQRDIAAQRNAAKPAEEAPIRQRVTEAGTINDAVKHNKAREELQAEVRRLGAAAEERDREFKKVEQAHKDKIAAAALPVPGLSFTSDGVMMNEIPFDQCSAAQKLRTSLAIALALNPELKLVLVRDGSLISEKGMAIVEEMAQAAGAQVIVERVENGKDVGIRIVEGETAEPAEHVAADAEKQ